MKKNIFLLKILIVYFLLIPDVFTATSNYFDEGRKLFNKKEGLLSNRWEQTYFTLSRDIMYYANCDISDIIIYKLNNYEIINNEIIKISSSLYRKSDRKNRKI